MKRSQHKYGENTGHPWDLPLARAMKWVIHNTSSDKEKRRSPRAARKFQGCFSVPLALSLRPLPCLTIPTTTSLCSSPACSDLPRSKPMAPTRPPLVKSSRMRCSSSSLRAWYVRSFDDWLPGPLNYLIKFAGSVRDCELSRII